MKLAIVIPTLNRREKLQRCLHSILSNDADDDIQLDVYFGEQKDLEYFKELFNYIPHGGLFYLPYYSVPAFWNGYLADMKSDAMLYLNDDVELFDDTLKVILTEYPKRFPDYDGLMGICQANLDSSQALESAFGVIGKKYAERFPQKQVYCPQYQRFFGDWEMWQYAKKINKFYFCKEAKINHFHPSLNKDWEDSTHHYVRTFWKQDKQIFERRKAKGLLWGESFQLI